MGKPTRSLEAFSFTLPEDEAAAVYLLVTSAGFPATSQGVKDYLLHQAGVTAPPGEEEAPKEDLSGKVGKILEALERNPEVTEYAIKKGAHVLGSLFKRLRS